MKGKFFANVLLVIGVTVACLAAVEGFTRLYLDDGLLYELETPTSQGGRGLTTGRFYDRNGALVASVAQEAMLRRPESP